MSIIVNGVELTEVIYAGVNLDIVKVKKGTAEAVTVFEKITQLATPQNVTADGTTVSWDTVENATSYAVLADGSEIGTVQAAANLISFTIAGTSYQAEEGMTWEQWVNSSYNTDGYIITGASNNYIGIVDMYVVMNDATQTVEKTDKIISSYHYKHVYSSGGGAN